MSDKTKKTADFPEVAAVKGGPFKLGGEHSVTLPDFFMGKYPITNSQYALFLQDYGSDEVKSGEHAGQKMFGEYPSGIQQIEGAWQSAPGFEDHPVIVVSWYGAVEYCNWLSKKTGHQYHLPSEAEWEYAASGGPKSKGFPFAGGHKLKQVGWYEKNSHGQTSPVGLKQPNELGLYDMSGNVFEWCADHWHENYEGAPNGGRAWVTGGDATRRVFRGGSWVINDYYCRVAYRYRYYVNDWSYNIGFRVARYCPQYSVQVRVASPH